ncbi:MAG: hypothetical protein N2Z74_09145, partial [Syntrophales bacterium]|nr:hypothetical protein [Syntrophales bacterium]
MKTLPETLDELWVKFNAKFENIERGLKEMQTQGRKVDSIWKGIGNTVKTVFSFFAIQKIVQWGKALIGMGTDSARQMRQVDAALAALGDRFVKMRPLIDEHAQKMIALGFDDEETARSMAHLLGVTRDWNTALQLNAVAMDLAAYKNISLEAATQALS